MAEKTFRVRVVYPYNDRSGPHAVGMSRPYEVVSVSAIEGGSATLMLPDGAGIITSALAYHFGNTSPDDIMVHGDSGTAVPWSKARSDTDGPARETPHLQGL